MMERLNPYGIQPKATLPAEGQRPLDRISQELQLSSDMQLAGTSSFSRTYQLREKVTST